MSRLQQWGLAFGVATAAIVICYLLVDRPVAWLAHVHLRPHQLFVHLTYIPEPLPAAATVLLLVVGLTLLSRRPAAYWQRVAATWSFTILAVSTTKTHLKSVFGRTWPETWNQGNPSLIRDDVFGFNLFPAPLAHWYDAFPSGHMAAICAAVTVLWVCCPRLRPVYVLLVAAVVVGLIGANFHFVSDIVAGGVLGTTVALIALRLADLMPAEREPDAGTSAPAPPLT